MFITDGPNGKPVINASDSSAFENQKVVLTCVTTHLDSIYPRCEVFRWNWTNEYDTFHEGFIQENQFTFLMKESYEGQYQCKCENKYGSSDYSDPVYLAFRNSTLVGKCIILSPIPVS